MQEWSHTFTITWFSSAQKSHLLVPARFLRQDSQSPYNFFLLKNKLNQWNIIPYKKLNGKLKIIC